MLILAGDVGGTKTWLGLFSLDGTRLAPLESQRYPTLEFDALTTIVARFLDETGAASQITAACFGVAGPVQHNASRLTHVPWVVDGSDLATRFNLRSVWLLNDLVAMAHAVPVLSESELARLQTGAPSPDGNAALIAPGTGLGEAALYRVEHRLVPAPSQGGHADFAARTPRELELTRTLIAAHGRVALEDVVSGRGLVTLFTLTHQSRACDASLRSDPPRHADLPAKISSAALAGTCGACVEALDLFTSALGAAAGNLALRAMATAGVYVGGGIAPQILPLLQAGPCLEAFRDKGSMRPLLERMPLSVILRPDAALLGAAAYARDGLRLG